jgi:hypothetical protein
VEIELIAQVLNNNFPMSAETKEEEEDVVLTPPDLVESADQAVVALLPQASKERYDLVYHEFMDWREKHHAGSFSERTILAFLNEKKEKVSPNTLWSLTSMLKATLLAYHNVKLADYGKLTPFLKQNSVGYKPKKAKIFSKEQIDEFLLNAPNDDFLMQKVIFELKLHYFYYFFLGCNNFGYCWCLQT